MFFPSYKSHLLAHFIPVARKGFIGKQVYKSLRFCYCEEMKTTTKIFVLSKKNLSLSIAEVQAQYDRAPNVLKGNCLFVKSRKKCYKRLAFTKEVYDVLFSCSKKVLLKKIKKYDWNKKINGTYCVRSVQQEREIAGVIWQLLKNPRVSLETPETLIHFFFIGGIVYCCILGWENDNACLQRKPHTRPGFYPASLDPQLARAMVNLAGVQKGVIVDPFCGTGGILIEAAFLGHRCYGYDHSVWMLKKCVQNIAHYCLRNVVLQQGDARTFFKKCAAIVTDPPFGKNTKKQDIAALYHAFLENAKRSTQRIVMNFPNTVNHKQIIRTTGWKMQKEFSWYVHNSLTRMIVVLERK